MPDATDRTNAVGLFVSSTVLRRFGLVAAGSFLLFMGEAISTLANGNEKALVVVSLFVYVLAFGLLVLAATRLEFKYADLLILFGVLVSLLAMYYVIFSTSPRNYLADNLAFAQTSAEMVVKGQNPYSVKDRDVLTASAKKSGFAIYFITRQPDGKIVDRLFVYPAGLLLTYTGPVALGLKDLRWVAAITTLLILVVLWWQAPPVLRPLSWLPVLVSFDHSFLAVFSGAADAIWLLPLMLSIVFLNKRRLDVAALLCGISIAIKQQPWLLIPFIAIWLWIEARHLSPAARASVVARFFAISTMVFVIINLPFMVWNFKDWFTGLTWEFSSKQVFEGTGLSALSSSGVLHLGRDAYTLLSVLVLATLLICYARYYSVLKHAVWIFPGIVFWFAYRGLQNYFIFWVPLLLLGVFTICREQEDGKYMSRSEEATPVQPVV